jgi:RNA polymerase sigma-70 factor (ECF subfamily)
VLKVPPQYRLVLVLHDMEGLETAEVARITGLRQGTVRVRLHRARLLVRKELARMHAVKKPQPTQPTRKPRRCRELFAALSDYMDAVLDDSLCDELENHLEGCAPCKNFLDSLQRTVKQCQSLDGGCKSRTAGKARKKLVEEYRRVLAALKQRPLAAG